MNHAHKLHVTIFTYSVSFTDICRLSLMWCIIVLWNLVTVVGRCGTLDRCSIDPTGLGAHSSVVLYAERVLSRCLSLRL